MLNYAKLCHIQARKLLTAFNFLWMLIWIFATVWMDFWNRFIYCLFCFWKWLKVIFLEVAHIVKWSELRGSFSQTLKSLTYIFAARQTASNLHFDLNNTDVLIIPLSHHGAIKTSHCPPLQSCAYPQCILRLSLWSSLGEYWCVFKAALLSVWRRFFIIPLQRYGTFSQEESQHEGMWLLQQMGRI